MKRKPWFPFYAADWLLCEVVGFGWDYEGFWLRMLIVMHSNNEDYGKLTLNGKPMPDEYIAKKIGATTTKYRKYLKTLDDVGFIKRDEKGAIFSKKLIDFQTERESESKRQARYYKARRNEQGKSNRISDTDSTKFQQNFNEKPTAVLTPGKQLSNDVVSKSETDKKKKTNSKELEPGFNPVMPSEGMMEIQKWVYNDGSKFVESSSEADNQTARKFIGRLLKSYGQKVTASALEAAMKHKPANPFEYLTAICEGKIGEREPKSKGEQTQDAGDRFIKKLKKGEKKNGN